MYPDAGLSPWLWAFFSLINSLICRVRKILNLRLFADEKGDRWKKSLKDINGEILCVSQVSSHG